MCKTITGTCKACGSKITMSGTLDDHPVFLKPDEQTKE